MSDDRPLRRSSTGLQLAVSCPACGALPHNPCTVRELDRGATPRVARDVPVPGFHEARFAAAGRLAHASPPLSFSIAADAHDPENAVIVTAMLPGKHSWRIRIEKHSADPEHRLTAYRLAAGWFGNLPARHAME